MKIFEVNLQKSQISNCFDDNKYKYTIGELTRKKYNCGNWSEARFL